MPTKVKSITKRSSASGHTGTIRDLLDRASQLPDSQLRALRKKLDELHLARWRREREEVAKKIAAQGITEESMDEFIMRRRRESRH